jgi:energy-coupling factor transporter ATP-binding protein EcfA2
MLQIKDLTVKYNTRSEPAASSVSLKVEKGEFVLLTGDSASGKSTVMQAVCGFIPTIVPAKVSGEVRINGKVLQDPMEIARTVCMVQQDPETQFCTDTVREEVAFGPENFCFDKEKIISVVEDSLKSVGATHLVDRKLSTLSGGEKQKVAIASVLALEPELIILDEPTSSLDPRSVKEVVAAIRALGSRRALTTIVVEHRTGDFIDLATRIVKMMDGRIVSDALANGPEFGRFREEERAEPTYPKMTKRTSLALSVQGLSWQVDGEKILNNVSFEVKNGSVVALMGENGAGKTTLLRHISGLTAPQTGRIIVFDHVISQGSEANPWILAKDIGFVFQNPNHQIFGETIEKEIAFASVNFQRPMKDANDATSIFANDEKVDRRTHPNCLSLGQKRRLNIISSSVHGPRLLLLDEPFVGQDRANALKIAELIAKLQMSGRTFIVVTHDLQFAKSFCTDAVLMNRGEVVASGRPEEALGEGARRILEGDRDG